MVSQAAADGHLLAVWLLLTAASAGVFLHAGIKFPWFVFFQKDSGLRPPTRRGACAGHDLASPSLCIGLGIWPEPLYALLPYPGRVRALHRRARRDPAAAAAVLRAGVLRACCRYLRRTLTITLDSDWVWRRLLPSAVIRLDRLVVATRSIGKRGVAGAGGVVSGLVMRHRGPDGSFIRTSSIRVMALWVLVLLLGYLMLYYL